MKMGIKKTILILTDDTESSAGMAKEIAVSLKGHKVKIRAASVFEGTDLLPADVIFFGCEKPNPPSFNYIEKLLRHINLSSRICGVFGAENAAAKYLARIIKDSEAAVYPDPLFTADKGAAAAWAGRVIEKNRVV